VSKSQVQLRTIALEVRRNQEQHHFLNKLQILVIRHLMVEDLSKDIKNLLREADI
jgi:hypothetical protein